MSDTSDDEPPVADNKNDKQEVRKLSPTQRKEQKAAVEAELSLDDQIQKSLDEGITGKRRKQKFSFGLKALMLLAGCFVVYSIYGWLFAYPKGGMRYGICKAFAELYVQYPTELRFSFVRVFQNTMRVSYAHHDAYGQTRLDTLDCMFFKEPDKNMFLEKVLLNRRELDPKKVMKFNQSIPVLFAFPPNLEYPPGLPDSLQKLKLGE